MTPAPMNLERALEVAIEACDNWAGFYDGNRDTTTNPNLYYDGCSKAAAYIRAALPFIKAAEAMCANQEADDPGMFCCQHQEALQDAYRAMKEAK